MGRKSGFGGLRTGLYKAQRAIGDAEALSKSPAAYAKRRVRRGATKAAFQNLGAPPTLISAAALGARSRSGRSAEAEPVSDLPPLTDWLEALSHIPAEDRVADITDFLDDLYRLDDEREAAVADSLHDTLVAQLCAVIAGYGVVDLDPDTVQGIFDAPPSVWHDVRAEIVSIIDACWANSATVLAAFFNSMIVTIDGARLEAEADATGAG